MGTTQMYVFGLLAGFIVGETLGVEVIGDEDGVGECVLQNPCAVTALSQPSCGHIFGKCVSSISSSVSYFECASVYDKLEIVADTFSITSDPRRVGSTFAWKKHCWKRNSL